MGRPLLPCRGMRALRLPRPVRSLRVSAVADKRNSAPVTASQCQRYRLSDRVVGPLVIRPQQ
jgi:hypothetical protein